MELIPDPRLDYYERLLLRRDTLKQEAYSALLLFTREVGALESAQFEAHLKCIEIKHSIAFCQMQVNQGKHIDLSELQAFLHKLMAPYQKELQTMVEEYKTACFARPLLPEEAAQVKALYRKIAKAIHPDLHAEAQQNPAIPALWAQVQEAYRSNDLEALEQLDFLVARALAGQAAAPLCVPDLEQRIQKVKAEIHHIKTTLPYQYRAILEDPEALEELKDSYRQELAQTRRYARKLAAIQQSYLRQGVILPWTEA